MSEIREGDNVLFWMDPRHNYLIRVRSFDFHTDKGTIRVGEAVGKKFGEWLLTSKGVKVYLLKPVLSDYIMKSERKTQIIYPKDIGLILLHTGIGPGSRVVEVGTGSAALTTALAYYVRPSGRVYTYEIREEFLEIAKRNLQRAGLLDFVEMKLKDAYEGIDERDVDAVTLDVPEPERVIPHAYEALKGSGCLASFSPTIEQVVRTVEALREHGFADIRSYECLLRRYRVARGMTRPETRMVAHTGYITFARKVVV